MGTSASLCKQTWLEPNEIPHGQAATVLQKVYTSFVHLIAACNWIKMLTTSTIDSVKELGSIFLYWSSGSTLSLSFSSERTKAVQDGNSATKCTFSSVKVFTFACKSGTLWENLEGLFLLALQYTLLNSAVIASHNPLSKSTLNTTVVVSDQHEKSNELHKISSGIITVEYST